VFDFSFPEEDGNPNPHLWLNVAHSMRYAIITRDSSWKWNKFHSLGGKAT